MYNNKVPAVTPFDKLRTTIFSLANIKDPSAYMQPFYKTPANGYTSLSWLKGMKKERAVSTKQFVGTRNSNQSSFALPLPVAPSRVQSKRSVRWIHIKRRS